MKIKLFNFFDYLTEYSLYGALFVIPASKAGIETFLGFAFFGFIVKKLLKPDFKFLKSLPHIFLLFFVFFSALSLFNSGQYFMKSFAALSFKWLEYIACFLVVEDTLSNPKRIRNAAIILLIAAGIIALDGLSQAFFGIEFLRHKSMIVMDRGPTALSGPFNHYNDFGAYLAVVLSLVIAFAVLGDFKKTSKLTLSGLIVLLGVSLLFTYSRGSWLGFIFALFAMLILSNKPKPFAYLFGIFILLLIFLPQFRERIMFTFQGQGDADRFIVWQTAFRMIKENPLLGKGIGTFMDYFHKYTPNLYTQYAHNCYLQIWAETGIFSLVSFLLFAGAILYRGIKIFRGKTVRDSPLDRQVVDMTGTVPVSMGTVPMSILLGLICGIFAFLVHSFFDTHLYSLQLATLFWFMLGLTVAVTKLNSSIGK